MVTALTTEIGWKFVSLSTAKCRENEFCVNYQNILPSAFHLSDIVCVGRNLRISLSKEISRFATMIQSLDESW